MRGWRWAAHAPKPSLIDPNRPMINPSEILAARILIVDDEPANVALLVQLLEGAGYTSLTATHDPFAVCDLHRVHAYDLFTSLERKAKIYQCKEDFQGAQCAALGRFLLPQVQRDLTLAAYKTALQTKLSPGELTEQTLLQQVTAVAALVNENGNKKPSSPFEIRTKGYMLYSRCKLPETQTRSATCP